MKLQKKLLTLLMVMALLLTFSVSAFARATTEDRITRVWFETSTIRMDPGDTYTLTPLWEPSSYSPSYLESPFRYSSSDTDIAHVDDNGVISAYEPGQVTITVTARYSSARATASVTVTGTPRSSSASTVKNTADAEAAGLLRTRSSASSATSATTATRTKTSTSSSKSGAIELTGKASREEVVASAQAGVPVSNYQTVSAESLQSASNAVMFDTKAGSAVVGRLTVNPANAKSLSGDLLVGVYSGNGNTKKVQETFEKYYNNDVRAILCDQKNYGMNVSVAVNVGSLDASNLKFYSYNESTNQYNALTVSDVKKDANNYLHFTTSTGGYIIVSDGTLARG